MSTTRVGWGVAALVLAAALTACAPEPGATPEASPTATSSASSTSAPSPTPTPTPTTTADAGEISLPGECRDIYSAAMLATLEQQIPPLNDPDVTLLSTQNATLLEMLDTVPTLRCSWGAPSEVGLATNVSIVDPAQSEAIAVELANAGYGCAEESGATICRTEQRGLSFDDTEYTRGETHALRGNAWVATAWLNYNPDGYTEDILATLWG